MDFSRYDDEEEDQDRPSRPVQRDRRSCCQFGCLSALLKLALLLVLLAAALISVLPFWLNSLDAAARESLLSRINKRIAPGRIACKSWRFSWLDTIEFSDVEYKNPATGISFTAKALTLGEGLLKSMPVGRWNPGAVTVESPRLVFAEASSGNSQTVADGGFLLPVLDLRTTLSIRRGEIVVAGSGGDGLKLRRFQGTVVIPSLYESLSIALTFAPGQSEREAEVNINAGWKSGGIRINELKIVSPWLNASGRGQISLDETTIPDNALSVSLKADATAISRDFRSLFSDLPRMVGTVEIDADARQMANKAVVNADFKLVDFAFSIDGKGYSSVDGAKGKCNFHIPSRNGAFLPEVRDASAVLVLNQEKGRFEANAERWSFAAPGEIGGGKAAVKGQTKALMRMFGCWVDPGAAATIGQMTDTLEAEASFSKPLSGPSQISGRFQPLRYKGIYAGVTDFRIVATDDATSCLFSSNLNGGQLRLNPVFAKDRGRYRVKSAGRIRMLENVRLTQEMIDAWLTMVNPLFSKSRIEKGSVTVDLLSFSFDPGRKEEGISLTADVVFDDLILTLNSQFDDMLKQLKVNDRKFAAPKLAARLKIDGGRVYISRVPFKLGEMNFALSGSSSFAGELDYVLEFEITERMLDANKLSFLAPLFKGKMFSLNIRGTVEKPEIKANSLIDGVKNLFATPEGNR